MLGIISDVHGNYPALKAVLEKLDAAGCKEIISLGDVCGYYCMVNECIETLRERNVKNIIGNHDFYIIHNGKCERSYSVNVCLDYQRKILTEKNLEWVKESVSYIKKDDMWMVHGGWNDYVDEYISDFSFLDEKNADTNLFISGHTHVQKQVVGKNATYFNPGSVGQPRDHIPTAAYAIIDDEKNIFLNRTEYDIDEIDFAMRKAGFAERFTSCLYHGMKIGEDGR